MRVDASGASGLDLLSHPLVLKGAWMRVDAWYRSGNLAPEPELSRWRLHPEAELREIGAALRAGKWRPSLWQQVPYPKKGACLRHYVVPTVRDQVAFMAYMVLLGPLVDSRVPDFVFGNRWNRKIVWDRRCVKPQWVLHPYQLLTNTAYLPYSRSHGMFRRVTHWTVARMTGARIEHKDYGGYVQHPDDYASRLPQWTRREWSPPSSDNASVYWAALDIELAYPSIYLGRLRKALVEMLGKPSTVEELKTIYGGYPQPILVALANRKEVQCIAGGLVDALEKVEIDAGPIPENSWRPKHAIGNLPPQKDSGLPTGLAVSGILLNVALHPADQSIERYLHEHRHEAITRFADEIFVLARSLGGLFDLMEAVWRGLAQDENARLANPETESNLHLNWTKIEPKSIHDIIVCFLKAHGWKKCEHGTALYYCTTPDQVSGLRKWWYEHREDQEYARMSDATKRSAIGSGEVGPFVTTLVARMSEIGRDTLTERFGEGARQRLIRLHDLARFDIDDVQVRSDTRRAFAANRLVRAWLPPESSRRDLADIRDSVAHVFRNTPWKFSLWRAVVRAAARRPQRPNQADDRTARDWLSSQLGLIADPPDERRLEVWMTTWPEDNVSEQPDRDPSWLGLYLSFHRTAFWQALAEGLRWLWRHDDEASHPVAAGYAGPSPSRWTVRAIPQGAHASVRRHLGALDQWVDVLYKPDTIEDLRRWPWELNQLTAAAIASASRYDLAVTWRHAEPPGDAELKVPAGPLWRTIPKTIQYLELLERVSRHSTEHDLGLCTLPHLWLGGQDRRLGDFLFPRGGGSRIDSKEERPRIVAAGISLGCSESISAEFAEALVPKPTCAGKSLRDDGLALWEYHRARSILLGQPGELR